MSHSRVQRIVHKFRQTAQTVEIKNKVHYRKGKRKNIYKASIGKILNKLVQDLQINISL